MNYREDFPPHFRLGPWLVQPDLNRISGDDGESRLEPLVMKVLLCLAKQPGEVWSRQALLDEVWADAIVGEEILTRAISELRRAFGDKARSPIYIETIRNHGYRLIETPILVERSDPRQEQQEGTEQESQPESNSEPKTDTITVPGLDSVSQTVEPLVTKPPSVARQRNIIIATALCILAGAIYFIPKYFSGDTFNSSGPSNPTLFANPQPLTSFPGREWHPALSADGHRVAFVWSGHEGTTTDIYVKQRNSETLLQLTHSTDWVAWPTWSPDGQWVAYVQGHGEGSDIKVVSSLGGAVRTLLTLDSWVEGLDYSPDGKTLVFSSKGQDEAIFSIKQLNIQSLQVTNLKFPSFENSTESRRVGDFQPRYSPDGSSLAWVSVGMSGHSSLYSAKLANGLAQKIGGDLVNVQGLAFSVNGKNLIYSASPGGTFNLWTVNLDKSENQVAQLIPTPGAFAWNPNLARKSGDLVFEQVMVDQDIWRVNILGTNPWKLQTQAFVKSTRWEFEAVFSPDAKSVAFVSSRSGSPELWLADADGKNLSKLTHLGSSGLSHPRWSPDGLSLGFNSLIDGRSRVMVISSFGGEPKIMTPEGQSELFSSWSGDGLSLLCGSDGEGSWRVLRRYLDGRNATLVTQADVATAVETTDGKNLYFSRTSIPGLWVQPLKANGEVSAFSRPELVVSDLATQDSRNWALENDQVFWVLRTSGMPMLAVTELNTGRTSLLTELIGLTAEGLTASAKAGSILYPRTGQMAGDLMVLSGPPKK